MTRLEEIKFEVNCAAFEAMDEKLRELLPAFGERRTWITDKLLPRLLPALEQATELALREVYDLMPESLDVEPEIVERTRQQLENSLQRVKALGGTGL